MKNFNLVLAVMVLIAACAPQRRAAKDDAKATDDKSKTTEKVAQKDLPALCKDVDLTGGWEADRIRLKIQPNEKDTSAYQEVMIHADYQGIYPESDDQKTKSVLKLDRQTCWLTKTELKTQKATLFKLDPSFSDSKLVSWKLTPCSDEKCSQALYDQKVEFKPYVESKDGEKTAPKEKTENEALSCRDINWIGQWTEAGTGITRGCSGERSNTLDLELKSVGLHLYSGVQVESTSGFVLSETKTTLEFKYDLDSCVVTETVLKKVHTQGPEAKEEALPEPTRWKIVGYSKESGKRNAVFAPCLNAACDQFDGSKSVTFESPIPND